MYRRPYAEIDDPPSALAGNRNYDTLGGDQRLYTQTGVYAYARSADDQQV